MKGDMTCADNWTFDPSSAFLTDFDLRNVAVCSFNRPYQVTSGITMMVGSSLIFVAGFNEFASSTSVGAFASGISAT